MSEKSAKHTHERPAVDLTSALGEAGHELADLHAEDVADDAPLVDEHGEYVVPSVDPGDFDEVDVDIAGRGAV